ncbi:MAG: HAD family phosphatase [Candidatus Promineifilaceae bacterium]|nr:HAD family phosphatase [Candidatus Promineifilaceae bacterium]
MQDIAIVFDVDGLMVDTEPLSRLAWNRVLKQYGYELHEELYSRMIGYRFDVSVSMVLEAFDLPLSVEEIRKMRAAEHAKILSLGVPVLPGLYDLVEALDQRGLSWAVATSSPYTHAVEILRQLELSDTCKAIAAGDEVPHGKPAPDIYLLAAKRLETAPQLCLALEDSAPGTHAALAAGMLTIAVPNGDSNMVDFPDVYQIFYSLQDVVQALDGLLIELDNRRRNLS